VLSDDTRTRIDQAIASSPVVLFMKGTRRQPQCGFSATVVGILDELVPDYRTVDVLADPEIRDGVKAYSNWPTVPQLYVKGEFVGGCDIVKELYGTGELHALLGVQVPERRVPNVRVTDAAAAFLRGALEKAGREAPGPPGHQAGGKVIHLRIDGAFETQAYLGPAEPGDLVAEANGVALHFDLASAQRAEGLAIDHVETREGHELRIDNPNAPPPVRQIDAQELKRRLDAGEATHLYDVRGPDERALAHIEGARPLDPDTAAEIERLPRETALYFHCHHGGRSQQAAEHFRALGFRNVHNVQGGIDAWSREVDPSVPRY
jgi:monothiol glutaredoxin